MSAELVLYCVKCDVCKTVIQVNNPNMVTLHYDCWIKVLKDMDELKRNTSQQSKPKP